MSSPFPASLEQLVKVQARFLGMLGTRLEFDYHGVPFDELELPFELHPLHLRLTTWLFNHIGQRYYGLS